VSYPTANAGPNLKVILPLTSTTIDGSASSESASKSLTYSWTQNYGPTVVQFSNASAVNPVISGLVEGTYSLKLTVTNTDLVTDSDELLIMVTSTANALPTVSLITPANNTTFTEGNPVSITANASDFNGTIQRVDFYQNDILISSDTFAPYAATWNPVAGNYNLTAKATDNDGAVTTSQIANVTIAALMVCSETSKVAQQGAFTIGYKSTFETVGSDVHITFELLDTNKAGVIAYLWKQTPFGETDMVKGSGNIFTATISGQTKGTTINYACKFAYAGGLSVTKYFSYVVGNACSLGLGNYSELKQIIYPNPVKNTLNLQLLDNENRIFITDMLGRKLLEEVVESSYSLDMSSFEKGIYILTVENTYGIQNMKILKE